MSELRFHSQLYPFAKIDHYKISNCHSSAQSRSPALIPAGGRKAHRREREMASVSLLPFFFLTLINFAGGLVFHLPSGRVKCITEDLRAGAMSVARYAIAADDPSPEIHNVSARVSDPQGEILHRAENVGSGEFSFAAAAAGEYTACFWSPHFQLSASVSIDFDWKIGVAAKNLAVIAKKGKVDVMETQLKKLEGSINSIHEEMIFLRERRRRLGD